MLENIMFSNIAKRIPVKAPDTGVAMNYIVLIDKCREFAATGGGIGKGFTAPAALQVTITAWQAASVVTAPALVASLRSSSVLLGKASAYAAGYLLGKVRRRDGDNTLDLRSAGRETTILNSPAYLRHVAGLYGDVLHRYRGGLRSRHGGGRSYVGRTRLGGHCE